ncbi:MAG: DUF4920 domain-containing protein [Myxococcota bacterium]
MIAWMLLACGMAPTEAPVSYDVFGAPFAVQTAVPAATVLADPDAHDGGPVRMTGELTQVCQKAGCWAVVQDDAGHAIRITMKDHAFGIAKDSVGRACDVEGQLVSKPVEKKTLDHYASEGGGTHPEAGQEKAWQLVATTVAVAK